MSSLSATNPDTEVTLAYRAAEIVEFLQGRIPTSEELKELTGELGVDLATMVLYQAYLASPQHGGFARQVNASTDRPLESGKKMTVAVVPSELNVWRRRWGTHVSWIRKAARQQGYQTEVIETRRDASVSTNARIIWDFICQEENQEIILVSYDRGSAEVRMLLHKKRGAEELRKVRAWVNIMGYFHGVSADEGLLQSRWRQWLARAVCGISGNNFTALKELDREYPLWRERCPLPLSTLAVSLIGFPLWRHIRPERLSRYKELAESGPNDGHGFLTDSVASPGLVYPVWGIGHMDKPQILEPALGRLLRCLNLSYSSRLPAENVTENQWSDDRRI